MTRRRPIPWTMRELMRLKALAAEGKSQRQAARWIGRHPGSVAAICIKQGIRFHHSRGGNPGKRYTKRKYPGLTRADRRRKATLRMQRWRLKQLALSEAAE